MKKVILILIFFISFCNLYSQSDSETSDTNPNPIYIGIGYERFIADFTPVNMFALSFELYVSKNISLNYNFSIGFFNNNAYIHSYAGLPAALYLMLSNFDQNNNNSSDIVSYIAFLLVLVPEGISFHFPMDNKMSLVPYVNPLGYDFLGNVNSFSSTIGMKLNINPISNFVIVPNVGLRYLYNPGKPSYVLGVTAGINF